MTCWPTRFDCHVWATPMAPVMIGMATMPAISRLSSVTFRFLPWLSTLFSRSWSRKAGMMPSPAARMISANSPSSRFRYGRKSLRILRPFFGVRLLTKI